MRMHQALCLMVGLSLAGSLAAQNLTQQNVERAQAIINSAVEAFGGAERLNALNSLTIKNETVNYATGQSRNPGPPWDRNSNSGISAVDFENGIFVNRTQGAGGGFEFETGTIINGEQSYQLNFRAGTSAPIAEPDFDTTSGPFIRVTPALLIKQLQQHARTAHYLGEAEVDGNPHEVVAFSMQVGPAISMYFDKQTHMLNKSERIFPGFGLVEYRFYDYSSIGGIPFNQRFALFVNGETNLERNNTSTQVNADISSMTSVPDGLRQVAAINPNPLRLQELTDGVYLVGGNGTYVMFVEMEDYIIAVGGTAGIPDRIAELRQVVPDKPIRYGVLTHHHNDHVLGVPVYADEGATVIAATAHAGVVRNAAGDDAELKLETVEQRKILEDDSRRVEIIDIGPTAHTEHLLVTYLPEEGILFEGDHFAMPAAGPVPPAVSSTRTFAEAIAKHNLEVSTFVSAHSARPGTPEDLQTALTTPVASTGSNR